MIVLDPALLEQVLSTIQEAANREARLAIVSPSEQHNKFPVWLHVYDLSRTVGYVLNNWLSRRIGLGAFHCGIEVLGAEWSFQAPAAACEDQDDRTGLMCHHAKAHPVHVYKESIYLGESELRVSDIWSVLLQLERQWLGNSYHAVRRNCTDFADAFATELRVPEKVPSWVHGIAKGYLKHTPLNNVTSEFLPRSCASSVSDSGASRSLITNVPVQSDRSTTPKENNTPTNSPEKQGVFFLPIPGQELRGIHASDRKLPVDAAAASTKAARDRGYSLESDAAAANGKARYPPAAASRKVQEPAASSPPPSPRPTDIAASFSKRCQPEALDDGPARAGNSLHPEELREALHKIENEKSARPGRIWWPEATTP